MSGNRKENILVKEKYCGEQTRVITKTRSIPDKSHEQQSSEGGLQEPKVQPQHFGKMTAAKVGLKSNVNHEKVQLQISSKYPVQKGANKVRAAAQNVSECVKKKIRGQGQHFKMSACSRRICAKHRRIYHCYSRQDTRLEGFFGENRAGEKIIIFHNILHKAFLEA